MSLLLYHEAVSFDSLQDQLFWIDDFEGDQIKDEWTVAGVGGSTTVVDGVTGGAVRDITGATNGNYRVLYWNTIRTLLVSKQAATEARVRLHDVIYQQLLDRYLHNDSLEYIGFGFNEIAGAVDYWDSSTYTAVDNDVLDTGLQVDTEWHTFRIQCHIHGATHIHFYIDDDETDGSPHTDTTTIPTGYLQVNLALTTRENVAKTRDIDYIAVRQDR